MYGRLRSTTSNFGEPKEGGPDGKALVLKTNTRKG